MVAEFVRAGNGARRSGPPSPGPHRGSLMARAGDPASSLGSPARRPDEHQQRRLRLTARAPLGRGLRTPSSPAAHGRPASRRRPLDRAAFGPPGKSQTPTVIDILDIRHLAGHAHARACRLRRTLRAEAWGKTSARPSAAKHPWPRTKDSSSSAPGPGGYMYALAGFLATSRFTLTASTILPSRHSRHSPRACPSAPDRSPPRVGPSSSTRAPNAAGCAGPFPVPRP